MRVRTCVGCKETKPFPFFSRRKIGLRKGEWLKRCKLCYARSTEKYRANLSEVERAAIRRKQARNARRIRAAMNPKEIAAAVRHSRKWRQGIRNQVLAAYGDHCVCCGEKEPVFLQLDHINGDGREHRRRLGGSCYRIYMEVRRQGFPKGFQILCANCNMAKWRALGCPHQAKSRPV